MEYPTLEEFLSLPWSDNVRHKLRVLAEREDVLAITAANQAGKPVAAVFTEIPLQWPDDVLAVWLKHRAINPLPKDRPAAPLKALPAVKATPGGPSKTMQAVQLVEKDGLTAYAAAKRIGISQSAVSRALTRRANREVCPCCGQAVRPGFAVNRDVLKAP